MNNAIYQSLVEITAKEETNRLKRFRESWNGYYGNLPKPLKVKPGNTDDNIQLNFARVIVDKGVSFLFGKEISFELDKVEGENNPAEEWLKSCWLINRKMSLLQKAALNGGVCGHCFIKIHYTPGMKYPRLIPLDPETITVTLAADDIDKVINYQIQYPSKDPVTKKPIYIRQLIEREGLYWKISDQTGNPETMNWQTVSTQNWAHDFPPIVECQNLPSPNEYWGVSDLEPDILEINQAINFTVSNMGRILKYHAHPKTWGSGFDAKQLQIAVDETLVLPSESAQLHNLEMQTDLTSSIEFYKRLKEALHETSRIPEVATGKLESTNGLSGLALQILYQPLVEKTNTKRLLYGDMLIELNRRLLALGGFGEENITQIHWQDMLPRDAKQDRENAVIDQQLGVSEDTLLTQLGYNPDLEREKKEANTEQLANKLLEGFDDGK